jgi:hypothetical protein
MPPTTAFSTPCRKILESFLLQKDTLGFFIAERYFRLFLMQKDTLGFLLQQDSFGFFYCRKIL